MMTLPLNKILITESAASAQASESVDYKLVAFLFLSQADPVAVLSCHK